MFKHILIPTDGSEIAAKAIAAGIKLAAEMGARVTGFHAEETRPLHLHSAAYGVEEDLIAEFDRRSREFAERTVATIGHAAKEAGVPFEALIVKSPRPYQAIIDAATQRKCDAIFMASHGHRGLVGLVLGSVTNQVLTHSRIPVLVFR
jgi:nucleotide-binding universal stress UspA family protein